MAGLLPRLQQGAIPGSEQWIYLEPIVPSAHPLESLAQVLWKQLPDKALRAIREDLESDSAEDTLHTLTSLLPKRPNARVVVLLDQFEELFTQTIDEHERRHFIDLLVTAITQPQGPVIVLLTLPRRLLRPPHAVSRPGPADANLPSLRFADGPGGYALRDRRTSRTA